MTTATKAQNNGHGTPPAEGFRRVVPRGYQQIELNLQGTSALLMSSGEADRDSDLYKAYVALGQTRKKSLEQEAQLRKMEWTLRLYMDDAVGPYIPSANVHELLRSAATKWKMGEEIKRSLVVEEYRIPLQYDGPRTAEELWEGGFRDSRMVANGGMSRGRVVRCRPRFEDWSIACVLAYDPEDIDADLLEMVVERSQKYGLGDYRPQFGSFDASLVEFVDLSGKIATGDGTKVVNRHDLRGHKAQAERIKKSA